MKIKNNNQATPSIHPYAASAAQDRAPQPSTLRHLSTINSQLSTAGAHSLRRDLGFWRLTFGGQRAILKHEQGLAYVAWLLSHPGDPIHGLALALKIRALRNGTPPDSAEIIQERALALDDAEAARRLFLKQRQLEDIVDDEDQTDPVKQEALRDLEAIYSFQKKNLSRTTGVAQKA